MSRRFAGLLVGAILALALGVVLWQVSRGWRQRRESPAVPAVAGAPAVPLARVPFRLYFPGRGGLLWTEERQLEVSEEPRSRAEAIVRALLAGPRGEGLMAPLPADVELTLVLLGSDGTAYLGLREPNGGPPPPSGSRREMLTVYSLVNSVVLNVPEARRVVLLWNGVQRETFAGHLATDRPLRPTDDLLGR